MTVSHHFLMAHTLAGAVFGPAQRLHGATLVVEAEFRRAKLDENGVICDLTAALELVKEVVAPFDCRNLDELPEFRGQNTTSEFLAGEIHHRLARRIREGALGPGSETSIAALKVTLRESPVAWAAYDAPIA
jgi:6-pyruvoyl-tetrahydropterin synthase